MAASTYTETTVKVYGATSAANEVHAYAVAAKAVARRAYEATQAGMGGSESGRKALSEYAKVFGLLNDVMSCMDVAEHHCKQAAAKLGAM
jgi:hypothetical protein